MKTIRHNTFETNSSSTHSITIINKNQVVARDKHILPLVVDNVLMPKRLRQSTAYTVIETGDGGFIVKAITPFEKAALLLHHVASVKQSIEYEELENVTEEQHTEIVSKTYTLLQERLGVSNIVRLKSYDFSHWSEDESYIIDIFASDDVWQSMINHIDNVVFNDDMIVIDEDIPY